MQEQSSYWSNKDIRYVQKSAFADLCTPYLAGTESILDLGSGQGEDSLHFARLGCSITAVDISDFNVTTLQESAKRENLTIQVLQQDIAHPFPFGNAVFDVVYAHLSVHYFDNETTKNIFREIYRILKPDGFFFVKCKSIDDPLYGKGEQIGPDMFCEEHPRHFFSEAYMRKCLAEFDSIRLEKTSSVYVDYKSAFIEAVARKSQS